MIWTAIAILAIAGGAFVVGFLVGYSVERYADK
jgi:hypothetical protein